MGRNLQIAALVFLLPIGFAGCAPSELFSWVDRNCFVADWTNHHSCLSCCGNGNCGQAMPAVEYEMLVLGNQPVVEAAVESEDSAAEAPVVEAPIDEAFLE